MNTYSFDIKTLSRTLHALAEVSNLRFYIFDDRGHTIYSSLTDDPLIAYLKTVRKADELYMDFIENNHRVTLQRSTPYTVIGPFRQHHIFIPVHYKEVSLVALAEAYYTSEEEFEEFYSEEGTRLGLNKMSIQEWKKRITIIPVERAVLMEENIATIIENIIVGGYERDDLFKRYQWSKTIVNILGEMTLTSSKQEIYKSMLETVLFLFNVDSAALYLKRNGEYHPEVVGGRQKAVLEKVVLKETNPMITKMKESLQPVSILDSHELWHVGFPEDIISLYLFPVVSRVGFFGFLGIFNTLLNKQAQESVKELCKLASFICGTQRLTEEYKRRLDLSTILSLKASQLYFYFKQPEMLYQRIVEDASVIAGAEKCSLMIPDEHEKLRVVAVKGINRILMEDVSIEQGQGIAGIVYEKGTPVLIDSEQGLKDFSVVPKSHFNTYSCMSVPLRIADEKIGVLNLSDKITGTAFTQDDLSVVSQFSLFISMLIKLAHYYQASEQMRELSIKDPLTGLYNRRFFDVRLEEEYTRAKRYSLVFSLAILDIDDFKLFNDTEGHLAGDLLLKEISSIISGTVRTNDIIARYGGEEFAIIMPLTSKEEAFNVSERVRSNVKKLLARQWKHFPKKEITISTGIAMYPECNRGIENLIRCADSALYIAKSSGKDRTIVWSPDKESDSKGNNNPTDDQNPLWYL